LLKLIFQKGGNTLKKQREEIGKIIIAPHYVEVSSPIIYLAGPMEGAVDWQSEAIQYIHNKDHRLNIASPRRPTLGKVPFTETGFHQQVDWEHFYLQRASEKGVILFWLAKEVEHRCDRAYAQTTRFELGEIAVIHKFTGTKVVVGIENGFSGSRYIRKTLAKKYPRIPVYENLKETCDTAIRLAIKM
jgi:hypothetical protein